MDPNEKKAFDFLKEAEGKCKKKGGFMTKIFGSSGGSEEAVELFEKAGNCFKMAKNWKGAGDAFVSAGNLQNDCGVKHEAASKYVDAANCFRKVTPDVANSYLLKAIEIYTEMGKFSIAAKHHMTIAEIDEEELNNIKEASENYQKAADYYQGEQASSQANKCRLKVAEFCMQLEQYEAAKEIYDEIGRKSMENKLLQYGAKDHFFKSILCNLCIDKVNAHKTMSYYEENYPIFTDSREYKLLKKLLTCLEADEVDGYVNAIKEYESISRLDPKIIRILLKVKKQNFTTEEATPEVTSHGEDDGIN